jgi:dTDP-4-amino-4,6-dideoxygalactose transaminase
MDHALSLPSHHGLTSDDLGYLVEAVDETFRLI